MIVTSVMIVVVSLSVYCCFPNITPLVAAISATGDVRATEQVPRLYL